MIKEYSELVWSLDWRVWRLLVRALVFDATTTKCIELQNFKGKIRHFICQVTMVALKCQIFSSAFDKDKRFSLAAAAQKQKGILISIRNGIFFETESFNSLFFSLRVKILPPLLRRRLLSFMGEKFTQLLIYLFVLFCRFIVGFWDDYF